MLLFIFYLIIKKGLKVFFTNISKALKKIKFQWKMEHSKN